MSEAALCVHGRYRNVLYTIHISSIQLETYALLLQMIIVLQISLFPCHISPSLASLHSLPLFIILTNKHNFSLIAIKKNLLESPNVQYLHIIENIC